MTGEENEYFDRKSLRKVMGATANWNELASDCVGFANGAGGKLLIGIEDDDVHPPASQRIEPGLPERIAFAMLAQTEGLSSVEPSERLELEEPYALRPWTSRLLDLGLVEQAGRTKATRYFVPPALLKNAVSSEFIGQGT